MFVDVGSERHSPPLCKKEEEIGQGTPRVVGFLRAQQCEEPFQKLPDRWSVRARLKIGQPGRKLYVDVRVMSLRNAYAVLCPPPLLLGPP